MNACKAVLSPRGSSTAGKAGIPKMPAFSLVRGLKLGCDDHHRHQSQDKSKESKPDQLDSPPSRASGPERAYRVQSGASPRGSGLGADGMVARGVPPASIFTGNCLQARPGAGYRWELVGRSPGCGSSQRPRRRAGVGRPVDRPLVIAHRILVEDEVDLPLSAQPRTRAALPAVSMA